MWQFLIQTSSSLDEQFPRIINNKHPTKQAHEYKIYFKKVRKKTKNMTFITLK